MNDVVIAGAGFTGLAAAWELARCGRKVTVVERDTVPGGLASTFELAPGRRVERFYHHWFASDTDVFRLVADLGAASEILELPSENGLYYANHIFRLSSPLDLLKFTPLPLVDRIRTGLFALYARSIKDWRPLERETAFDWVRRIAGEQSFSVIWQPLLTGKFGAFAPEVSAVWFWNKLKLRGSSRSSGGGETLSYYRGGFGALVDLLCRKLQELGVEIVLGTPVSEVVCRDGRVEGVATSRGLIPGSHVLVTAPLPNFLEMTPALPETARRLYGQIRFLGNVCLVLRLRHSLSSTYWLNVTDPEFPFVGVIEHTNFDRQTDFGGEHIVYLSKYIPTSDALYTMSDDEVLQFSVPHIKRLFPAFSTDWIAGAHVWRSPYSQPLVTRNYSMYIPPHRTPIAGLWLATMAQIYPEDRGTNYAVRMGRDVAKQVLSAIG